MGLGLFSQISNLFYGLAKAISIDLGNNKLSGWTVLLLIIISIVNILLMFYFGNKLNLFKFKRDIFTKRNIAYVLMGIITIRVIAIGGTFLLNLNGINNTANDETIYQIFNGENPILIILFLAILAPITEEIVFRGGIVGYLFKERPIVGILVSSVVFGLLHETTDIISFLLYILMGVVFAVTYYKTQQLGVSILIHFLNNLLPAIVMLFVLFLSQDYYMIS